MDSARGVPPVPIVQPAHERDARATNSSLPRSNARDFWCVRRPDLAYWKGMATQTSQARQRDPVTQFSVFTPNRLGRLRDLVGTLAQHGVHVLALTVLDTTDSAVIRFVVDDPGQARQLLVLHGFPYTESRLLAVEVNSAVDLSRLMTALLEAEVNINYLYAFIPHPQGKSILGLSMEDNDIAEQVLQRHQFRVLRQADISR